MCIVFNRQPRLPRSRPDFEEARGRLKPEGTRQGVRVRG